MPSSTFDELRTRHTADRDAALPGYASQLQWSAARLRTERERRMRILLAAAKARSPWHRERLRDVDAATFTEDDLPSLPTMSKDDLMDNFEAVVTDSRLTRGIVDADVERLPDNLYLFERYVVVASGGSSGRRGVFVYDWQAFVTFNCQIIRWLSMAPAAALPWANMWAPQGAHITWVAFRVFSHAVGGDTRVVPTLPIAEMVDRLNALQPKTLSGYASTLALLAGEARARRLASPIRVLTCGEPLLPEIRAEVEAVWPVHVYNFYGMSEGPYAFPCRVGDAMHLPDDLHYVEPVDEGGRAVPPGTPAAKLFVTNLFNLTEPLIRYEVTDQLVVLSEPCPCGVASRRVDNLLGRADDVFTFAGGIRVHPLAIRAPLGRHRHVVEYQVIQTERGVRVRFCANRPVDPSGLSTTIAAGLRGCGLTDPEVILEQVSQLSRQVSGKLKRFVPRVASA